MLQKLGSPPQIRQVITAKHQRRGRDPLPEILARNLCAATAAMRPFVSARCGRAKRDGRWLASHDGAQLLHRPSRPLTFAARMTSTLKTLQPLSSLSIQLEQANDSVRKNFCQSFRFDSLRLVSRRALAARDSPMCRKVTHICHSRSVSRLPDHSGCFIAHVVNARQAARTSLEKTMNEPSNDTAICLTASNASDEPRTRSNHATLPRTDAVRDVPSTTHSQPCGT